MTDPFTTKASDIMDEACLGEPYVSNGTDKALREAIAKALREAQSLCDHVANSKDHGDPNCTICGKEIR